ncbi:Holliday junction DNA helicase RuvA [Streptococcus dysgalactiae subsp. dysgalactiae]|uniref:Holliday junction branch migration complex subunit RuvA n=1 Tax=Streptococcus dysgalactiae subsp. dysgalactiae TaxID=99822 RepID=A0A380JR48_STRDY|nr:Holliday junction branch migration protein RuvA [Streptococcus dysgalactiae]MCB2833163.1 Holliday junction branch migration protein RuvA [Streptococcus dysgalactiae subsp. dysgalactiae]MCB2840869.1 Holliday junction branch migration protein RuvA [Streptococcus dysgalactiae subsp. dysgalactiae]MCB2844690.1 Holliday junction branch migration protein RuvA [Streptococcus dysgalactiae subsp. dysgalactiae]MCB2846938.1 Holliday junction branch migration protein RuvA [Streptococcus dysgalactiae subs
MYDYIKGQLTKITAKYIVVETNGLGYIINVANPYSFTDSVNQLVTIYLHQVIREDAHLLFGFHTEDEKDVFLKLISVSGIGPTTALAIVAVDDNQGLVNAIDTSDIKYLTKFPKIGKKTAQQMVLDLAGKFVEVPQETSKAQPPTSSNNDELDEAIEALLALGYKATELKKIRAFFEGTSETAEQYIKSALKLLMKG